MEEREFYIRLSIRERWSKRELERQFKAALSSEQCSLLQKCRHWWHKGTRKHFTSSKMLMPSSSSGLPNEHPEADPHQGLLNKLKDFLIELGRDFCFVVPSIRFRSETETLL